MERCCVWSAKDNWTEAGRMQLPLYKVSRPVAGATPTVTPEEAQRSVGRRPTKGHPNSDVYFHFGMKGKGFDAVATTPLHGTASGFPFRDQRGDKNGFSENKWETKRWPLRRRAKHLQGHGSRRRQSSTQRSLPAGGPTVSSVA